MPQSRAQNRVIDPVLTNVALDFHDPEFIAHHLFPNIIMPSSGAKVIKFGKEAFRKYNMRRAPGSKTVRVQFGHATDPIALVQDSIDGVVPREFLRDLSGSTQPNINLAANAVKGAMSIALRGLEIDAATLALDATQYDVNHKETLSGTDQWDNSSSDPRKKLIVYKEAIRSSIGAYPNVLLLPPKAFNSLADHGLLKEQFKYTSSKSLTPEMLAAYFDVEKVVVGKSVFAETETSDFTDIWSHAVLAYVPQAGQTINRPSYGYNYVGEGMPLAEPARYHEDTKSWIYGVEYERRPYLTSQAAGFLIQNPTS